MYFVNPILKYTGKGVFYLSSIIAKSYNDYLYKSIALNNMTYESVTFTYLVFIFLSLVVIGTLYLIKETFDLEKNASELYKKVTNEQNEVVEEGKTFEEIKNKIISLHNDSFKFAKKYRFYFSIIAVSLLLVTFINIATAEIVNDKVNSVNIQCEVIAPYIPEDELKLLKSNFHQIQNMEDYKIVYENINSLFKINGLDFHY